MGYSEVWRHFEKIMSDGLIKTADKKDQDYNIIPPPLGSDVPVEETGYELIEIAHPNQIQVANSQIEDGIVENGVEQQKAMVEIALRNPRGVLAEVVQTLVKAANILDKDMSLEAINMAKEVDVLLNKIAQENFYTSEAAFMAMKEAAEAVIDAFPKLHYGVFGVGGSDEKAVIDKFTSQLRRYLGMAKQLPPDQRTKWGQTVAAFVRVNEGKVTDALEGTKSEVFSDIKNIASRAWNDLVAQAQGFSEVSPTPVAKTEIPAATEVHKSYVPPTIPKAGPAPQEDVASKMPSQPRASRHYSVSGPEVAELQKLVGAEVDGKFGPQTFSAVMNESAQNNVLREYLHGAPAYQKSYHGWDKNAVEHVLLAIKQFRQNTSQEGVTQKNPQSQILDPYGPEEQRWQYGRESMAREQLGALYPQLEIAQNRIYPWGNKPYDSTEKGGDILSYPLNQQWINYLMRNNKMFADQAPLSDYLAKKYNYK